MLTLLRAMGHSLPLKIMTRSQELKRTKGEGLSFFLNEKTGNRDQHPKTGMVSPAAKRPAGSGAEPLY